MWLDRSPASVAFCDVETTGLGKDDRIVSFGGIGMITKEFAKDRSQLTYTYLVFDPGKRNHPGAQQVHGFSDWVLAAQEPFEVHAAQVWRFLTSYGALQRIKRPSIESHPIHRTQELSGSALTDPASSPIIA